MKQSLSSGHAIFCHAIFGDFATPDQAILLREISDFDDKKRMLECQEVRWTNLAKNKEIALIAVISGLTCKRGERVNSALY